MKRKPLPYTGSLAEPIELHAPFEFSAQNITLIARVLGISFDVAKLRVQELLIRDVDNILNRHRALYDHYGIDCKAPEAERTLALSLAARHEAEILFADERVDYGALCVYFETNDPAELVRKLANKHVPGLQPKVKEWQVRLTSMELAKVFFCVFAVIEHLRRRGEKESNRRVAEIMLDESLLPKVVPPAAARSVQSILAHTGNKKHDFERDLKARTEYLRKAISGAKNAWKAVKSGKAYDFQIQILSEVWPWLYHLPAAAAGQNNAGLEGKK